MPHESAAAAPKAMRFPGDPFHAAGLHGHHSRSGDHSQPAVDLIFETLRYPAQTGPGDSSASAGEAIAKRRLESGLDAVPASWTMGAEEDGLNTRPAWCFPLHPQA